MTLRYRLAVLTHGRSDPLAACLASFVEHVSPAPSSVSVYADGAARATDVTAACAQLARLPERPPLAITHPFVQLGFCGATRALWNDSTIAPEEYVFWLEHDFLFQRPVDLRELAPVLELEPRLAQVALCRGPANAVEEAAGGLVASRPGEFEKRFYHLSTLRDDQPWDDFLPWLEHGSYFTTNPSLMRRDFMVENPWPAYRDQCEGRFGADLVARGYRFGLWGDGSPWVEHVGARTGFGY